MNDFLHATHLPEQTLREQRMPIEPNSVSWKERYQVARSGCGNRLGIELEGVATDICNPVVKLRFLRDVIDNKHRIPLSLKYTILRPLRRALLQFRALLARTAHTTRARLRPLIKIAVLMCLSCGATVMAAYSYRTPTHLLPTTAALVAPAAPIAPPTPIELATVAETLPTDTLGITPTTIWLADHGANWELYSNGLRIETTYAVSGEPRRFRIHDREHGVQPTVHTKPLGILFHTSESDLWPLDASYDKQLRQSSTALLKYVQQERAYNYVVDRFGRVYRIVDDETRANHAGHSVWANGNDVYLDLNSSFVGVSFESRWEGGRAMPITRAQLIAGRNLTNYLRQRFAIAPEMCVTHGLTSVSPKQKLIGYHMDWARGFPFAAFGLPDQYALAPPSIALFGFSYNDDFIKAIGDGWPGAIAADNALIKQARASGISPDTLRAQRNVNYSKWENEARAGTPELTQTEPTNTTSRAISSTTQGTTKETTTNISAIEKRG